MNPRLNAVVSPDFEAAWAAIRAGLPDGPFRGVPYLIKDLHAPVAGLPLSHGSRLFAGSVFPFDSTTVRRLRAAGFVIAGRTNAPEFGMSFTTEPYLHGPARNPWSTEHSTGGSSGGAAAAVAGGMLPATHATDTAGSNSGSGCVLWLGGVETDPWAQRRGTAPRRCHDGAEPRALRSRAACVTAPPSLTRRRARTRAPHGSPHRRRSRSPPRWGGTPAGCALAW